MNDSLPLAGTKVVLIDDSNTIRRSGEIFLSQAGCLVVLAEDGLDGLCKVADTRPDIVLMDIMMPRLDGYQACALLKNQRAYADTPVIMLSSRDSLFDHARSRLAGAAQYLLKPFNKQSLIAAVSAQLQHRQGAGHE